MNYFRRLYTNLYDVALSYKDYQQYYGSISSSLSSAYFFVSLFIAILLLFSSVYDDGKWVKYSLQILPNILGFTLGGYAVVVALGNNKLINFLINTIRNENSLFLIVSSHFVHFILVQTITILMSLIIIVVKITNIVVLVAAMSMLIYSILLVVNIAFTLFTLSKWFAAASIKDNNILCNKERQQR